MEDKPGSIFEDERDAEGLDLVAAGMDRVGNFKGVTPYF